MGVSLLFLLLNKSSMQKRDSPMNPDAARNAVRPEKPKIEATDVRVKCSPQSVLLAARKLPFLSNRQETNRYTAANAISLKSEITGKAKKKRVSPNCLSAESDALFFYGQKFLLIGWVTSYLPNHIIEQQST